MTFAFQHPDFAAGHNKACSGFLKISQLLHLQCSSDICEVRIRVLYARTYARICLFVVHSHKFLYMKHCWSNKRPVIFMGMKKASKRNLHIVKTSCQSMKAIIFRVFDHFANSPTNLLDLKLPKMGRKLKQSLEVPISTHELYVFTRKVLCFSTCRQVVCEMFVV